MMKPLSLLPSKVQQPVADNSDISSPMLRKRADSLVFSITSQKFYSPKETMLIQSKQHEVSRQLQTLQLKLQNLQSRVERIDSDSAGHENIVVSKANRRYFTNANFQTEKGSVVINKENTCNNTAKIGKIVKKDGSLNKTTKLEKSNRSKRNVNPFTAQSRQSLISQESELAAKLRELSYLKKEVSAMKQSMEKTQRSKSICSERLSASKDLIKNLKKEDKKHLKVIQKLKSDLKKSENIRLKQKQVILKQQEQLDYYRQMFKIQKKLR